MYHVRKVVFASYIPSNSIVVHINLPQASHHFQLVISTISFNFLILLPHLQFLANKTKINLGEQCSRYQKRIKEKEKVRQYHTGKGKQLVTSRTLPTSNPRSCPVTKEGEWSLQCLIILRITYSTTRLVSVFPCQRKELMNILLHYEDLPQKHYKLPCSNVKQHRGKPIT